MVPFFGSPCMLAKLWCHKLCAVFWTPCTTAAAIITELIQLLWFAVEEQRDESEDEDAASSASEHSSLHSSYHADHSDNDDVHRDGYLSNSSVPSPVELKPQLPAYFPALQGCRNVEEFQCLNRIEEGTYGVVYRAVDRKTGL